MRRSKAFILTEILTGMLLQAGFILVLCTSLYLMLSFYTKTQQVLSARQRGERVIAYVSSRIKNAGLGLQECRSSEEIRDALHNVKQLFVDGDSAFPVAVTLGDWNTRNLVKDKFTGKKKFKGNRLTVLYTQRELDDSIKMITRTIESPSKSGRNDTITLSADRDAVTRNISVKVGLILRSSALYKSSQFNKGTKDEERIKYLNSYTAMVGTGKPLYIGTADNSANFSLYFFGSTNDIAYVRPGDELLYLKCEKMFVEGQNFKYQTLGINNNAGVWSGNYPHEKGILETYFELDTENNILDIYVLASGGNNDLRNTPKPASWPDEFWKSEYEDEVVYVSRASWKLKNLRAGFSWN